MSKNLTLNKVILSFIFFIFIWTLRIILLKPYIDSNYIFWSKQIINSSIKTIIWVTFSVYLIKKYNTNLNISFKEMFTTKVKGKIFFPLFFLFAIYHFIKMYIGGCNVNPNFHPSQLISQFLVVGILEELVFRGWFMNALLAFVSEKKANIISSVCFMFIHYPSYIVGGSFQFPDILIISTLLFILSIVFGWAFLKNRSLWTPIILHMFWDLLAITLV